MAIRDNLAPEQVTGAMVTGSADIHALGCVLFEAATREPHFEGRTAQAVVLSIMQSPRRKPSSLRPDAKPLDDIVFRAMAIDAKERFKSGAAMAEALRSI